MTTAGKYNVLVYRNNGIWNALKEELKARAEYSVVEGKGFVKVEKAIIHVFPEGTPVEEIEAWAQANAEILKGAKTVYADGTTYEVMTRLGIRKIYNSSSSGYLDAFMSDVTSEIFGNASPIKSPAEAYLQVFSLLADAGFQRVQIVLEHLSDYNPLMVEGFDESMPWQDIERLRRYGQEFQALIPPSITVELISIKDLAIPDTKTLVICHHHAFSRHPDKELWRQPHILMPYPQGFFEKAGRLCDISSVMMQRDFLEELRQWIVPERIRS